MIRIIALTLAFLTLICLTLPARAQVLDAEQFRAQLVGKKLETKRMGLTARLVFSPDGRVAMQAPVGSAEGTWVMQGNELCVTMTSGPRQGKRCGAFTKLTDGRYANSEGRVFTVR